MSPSASARAIYRLDSRAPPAMTTLTRSRGGNDEVVGVVARQFVVADPDCPARESGRRTEWIETGGSRAAGLQLQRPGLDGAAVNLQRKVNGRRGGTSVDRTGRDRNPFLVVEHRAQQDRGRDRHVRSLVGGDRGRDQYGPVGQSNAFRSQPPGALKIRNQQHFAIGQDSTTRRRSTTCCSRRRLRRC